MRPYANPMTARSSQWTPDAAATRPATPHHPADTTDSGQRLETPAQISGPGTQPENLSIVIRCASPYNVHNGATRASVLTWPAKRDGA